jgi:hypothetical protein
VGTQQKRESSIVRNASKSLNSPAAGGTSGGTASMNAFDLFDIDAIMLDLGEIGCDELVSIQA